MAGRSASALGRGYFALQACAGALWWLGVFCIDAVRLGTLGALDARLVAWFDVPLFVIASALSAFGLRWAVRVVAPWTLLVACGMALYATVSGQAGWGALLMLLAAIGTLTASALVLLGRLPGELLLIGPFAFRTARSGTTHRHVRATTVQVIVFWGTFLVLLPVVITWFERRWGLAVEWLPLARLCLALAGLALLLAASALGIRAAATMATRGEGTPLPAATAARLVVAGPYRFVRNPMAIAGIAQGIAVGLMLGSWLVVLYALAGSLLWNWVIRPLEEADLEARFDAEFVSYRARVPCWVPRLSTR